MSGYGIATDPRSYSARETLRAGTVIEIRAIRSDDKSRLLEHFRGLSVGLSYVGFFNPKQKFSERELAAFTELDFIRRVALVATVAGTSAEPCQSGTRDRLALAPRAIKPRRPIDTRDDISTHEFDSGSSPPTVPLVDALRAWAHDVPSRMSLAANE